MAGQKISKLGGALSFLRQTDPFEAEARRRQMQSWQDEDAERAELAARKAKYDEFRERNPSAGKTYKPMEMAGLGDRRRAAEAALEDSYWQLDPSTMSPSEMEEELSNRWREKNSLANAMYFSGLEDSWKNFPGGSSARGYIDTFGLSRQAAQSYRQAQAARERMKKEISGRIRGRSGARRS